jgi:hypothetical protein
MLKFKIFRFKLVYLALFIFIISIFSFSVFSFVDFKSENVSCSGSDKAIILISSSGSYGFGHSALLFEVDGSWFYFSWQSKKVVFVKVPPSALNDLNSFNDWVLSKSEYHGYIKSFDSAILVEGEFDSSINMSRELFLDYLSSQNLNANNFSYYEGFDLGRNDDYHFLFNNCVEVSFDVLLEGLSECDDFIVLKNYNPSFIPNLAKFQFEYLFGSDKTFW